MILPKAYGCSQGSWKKHELIEIVAKAQDAAFAQMYPGAKMLFADMHAGVGDGIEKPQLDLLGKNLSISTAELLFRMGCMRECDVVLCEEKPERRERLHRRFPDTEILENHKLLPKRVAGYDYALCISDPNGPASQGVDIMHQISETVPFADFVCTLNVGFIRRVNGTGSRWETAKGRYGEMDDPDWWLAHVRRKHLAQTSIIHGSNGFRYRILVVSNGLTQPCRRRPFMVIR